MSASAILVIEDNPPLRRMLSVTLRTAGYQVQEAGDGRDALALASIALPVLALQDLMLPDIEALTLLEELRGLPGARDLPVLAMSGSEEKLDDFRNEGRSFTGFLLKPIDSSLLLQVVDEYAPAALSQPSGRSGRRLLLADDDAVQRKLTRLQLERLGFAVTAVENGADALAHARAAPPDIIVSDVLMPTLDGFELCHAVRTDPMLEHVPIVLASSAYVEAKDRELALRAGASALVERGPDLTDLIEAVDACISTEGPTAVPLLNFTIEHAPRVRAQLDRQAGENHELRERAALSSVDLSVLAGISGVVNRSRGRTRMLAEALPRCLEAGGLAAAGVWLFEADGGVAEAAHAGPPPSVRRLRERVSASLGPSLPDSGLLELPRLDGQGAVLRARLGPANAPIGILAFEWSYGELGETRVAFTRAIAGQISEGLALEQAFEELEASRAETISRLALATESRDGATGAHTERVSTVSSLLATRAGLGSERTELIRLGSLMHDIGKIGVSDAILLKPGRLTRDEFELMKAHTTIGHRILAGSDVELLQIAATIALTHHERVDGTGYPQGLRGTEIPVEGRIVAIADVFDALTNDRVYRPAMTLEETIGIMTAGRGTHFDPWLLDLLLDSLDQIALLAA